jgi:predicted transcriptional regulator
MAICHESTAMQATAVQNRQLIVVSNDDEIRIMKQNMNGNPVSQVIPFTNGNSVFQLAPLI